MIAMKSLLLALAVFAPLWVFSQPTAPDTAPVPIDSGVHKSPSRYSILVGVSAAALVTQVNAAMEKGWEPAGGVTSPTGANFYQAMYVPAARRVERRNAVLPEQPEGK